MMRIVLHKGSTSDHNIIEARFVNNLDCDKFITPGQYTILQKLSKKKFRGVRTVRKL